MKRFLTTSLIFIIPIIIFLIILFFIMGMFLYSNIVPNQHGDLEKLSEIVILGDKIEYERLTSANCNKMKNLCVDLYANDTVSQLNDIDILTIGDSFSNNFQVTKRYANFTANALNTNVYNLMRGTSNPLQIAATALNNGLMDNLTPSCVVVEVVERSFVSRIQTLELDDSQISILKNNSTQGVNQNKNKLILGLKSNIKKADRIINYIKLQISDKPTIKFQINSPRFSIEPHNLYVYANDVRIDCCKLTDEQLKLAEEKLSILQKMYADKGIKLIFLLAGDKYGMYQDDIINNPYPLKTVATQLSTVLSADFYVNSKEILRPYVDDGVQDIYYATDTHWSPIAAEIIGNHIANMLNNTAK